MEMNLFALLDQGTSCANLGWLMLMFVVAFLTMEVKRQMQPNTSQSAGGFRKAVKRTSEKTSTPPEDVTKDYMEVVLERDSTEESWGLVWHVQGYKAQRFLIAGLEPNSPAGSCHQAQGLRGIRRGDELLSVNGKCQFQLMCQELARAEQLSLQFLKADVVLPLDESSDEEDVCMPPTAEQGEPVGAAPVDEKLAETLEEESCMERQPTELTESWLESSDVSRQSSEAQAEVPLVPSPERRGRDAAIKRADAPSKSSNKKRSRRGEGFSSGSASGSGSGSEQASCASKCPSTDWEYMMDNRPGSLMHTDLPGRDRQGTSHANNVVIVAGSPAIALQTASALGTVVGGGVFHPMQNVRGRQQLPVLPSSQMAAAPVIHADPAPAMGQMCPVVAERFVPQPIAELPPEPVAQVSRQGSKESSGDGSAASSGAFEVSIAPESFRAARPGSAPPGGCCMELPQLPRKRTYRSGKKVRAKRTRAAIRASQAAEVAPAPIQGEVKVEGSSARSGSAPPSCQGGALKNPEPEEGRLYYKPRRRAGKKVRQRMEHAIARRREQALMAEAAESCRMVSDDEGTVPAPKRAARAAKRADSPVSTVSTAISTAAATVSAVASTATTATSEGMMPRRSFYIRRPMGPVGGLPTMAEAAPETAPRASQRKASRGASSRGEHVSGEMEEIIGRQVLLTNLVHAPQFNGHWGHVDGFDSTSQRYLLRVFTGQPGAKPKIAKLRRDCFIVPKGEVPSEAGQPRAWQPTLRLGA